MTHSPADFTPLSYEAIASLSPATRRSMATDFLDGKDLSRARAFLPLIPFVKTESYGATAFDKLLAVKTLMAAEPEWLPDALGFIKAAYARTVATRASDYRYPRALDVGDVFVQLGVALRSAKASSNAAGETQARAKLGLLLQDPELEIAGLFNAGYNDGEAYKFIPAYLKSHPYISPIALAFSMEKEEPFLWRALSDRPEWRSRFDRALFQGATVPYATEESERMQPAFFTEQKAWAERPDLLSALLIERLEAERLSIRTAPRLVQSAPLRLALFPSTSDASARQALWGYLGADSYPMAMGRFGAVSGRDALSSSSFLSFFNRARALCPLDNEHESVAKALFHETPPGHGLYDTTLGDCLFSKDALMRQATLNNYKPLLPDGSSPTQSPYSVVLSAGLTRCLSAAATCGDPQTVERLLDAVGPESFASYPGARKGMDLSGLMIFAQHGDREVFEAALRWADANGVLDEAADSRAWVMNEQRSRKKGDLLALCVALADLEKASAFLALRPEWKMTLARDTAKAMGEKLRGEKAGRAVSAWESLLFSKSIAIKSPTPSSDDLFDEASEPAPAPRRARL